MQTRKRFLLTSFVALGGVYSAEAVPEYQIPAGKYLPAAATAVVDCVPGYYCPGLDNLVSYSETNDQGLSNCPNGYTSDSGASSKIQCYKACNLADFEHAQTTSGGNYYSFVADTCEPATCLAGWHVQAASPNTSNFQQYIGGATNQAVNSAYIDASSGQYYHNYNSGYDPLALDSATIAANASFYDMATNGDDAGLGLWAVGYGVGRGFVRGAARLSEVVSTGASDLKTTSQLGAESGTYCYCNVTGYRFWLSGSPDAEPWKPATSDWAYVGFASSLGDCSWSCVRNMSVNDSQGLTFRGTLLGAVTSYEPAYCAGNLITITWDGVGSNQAADGTTMSNYSANDHTGNTSISYGGNVVAPRTAWAPVGKRFKGWRFSATNGEQYTK